MGQTQANQEAPKKHLAQNANFHPSRITDFVQNSNFSPNFAQEMTGV